MSYYKVRSVAFKKSLGEIWVTCADSSIRPLQYLRSEYAKETDDFAEKCMIFWKNVLAANMQFAYSNKWYSYVNDTYRQMERIARGINVFAKDMDYKTSFYEDLKEYAAKTYLVPLVTKEKKNIDIDFEANFADKCVKKWTDIDKQRLQDKQICIHTALFSDVFPGWDILWCEEKNRTIIAKSSNYHNRLLNNADGTAVILPEDSGNYWSVIAYAKTANLPEIMEMYPQLAQVVAPEIHYQSEERAVMDGFMKVCDRTDGRILYAKESINGKSIWAEIVGF